MSAFSRGCSNWLYAYKSHPFIRLGFKRSTTTPHFFSTTSLLSATKKPKPMKTLVKRALPKTSTIPSKASSPPSAAAPPNFQSYAETLAQKSSPTLLYNAPSHLGYSIASYTTATFCVTYGLYTGTQFFLNPPDGLPVWISYAYAGIAVFVIAFGGRFALNTLRLVRSVTAVPKKNGLQLEFVLKKMFPLPFLPARRITVNPSECTIPAPFVKPPKRLTLAERDALRKAEEEEHARFIAYEQSHLMTRPFRDMKREFGSAWRSLVRSFSRDGFMQVRVNGKILKVDITGGWALDKGRALDRLLKVEPHYGGRWGM